MAHFESIKARRICNHMVSYIHVQARLTDDPQIKDVKTRGGVKEVYELSIAGNNYMARQSREFKKLLKKGSAVVITGQYYQNTYMDSHKNEKQVNCIN